ncbi:Uncharacterized protein OBRU01_15788 [Operophtera brumata]|uniref:Protein TEX261 n=1 Tax=Operophtera brumata TaxID=104452 RepID=A0A0L7L407_OPEBR|nr:Uncharacterized protein OBRU01_15788 [Operophtera brumata]
MAIRVHAAGLYYLAELVEEYSVVAKYFISWAVVLTAFLHIGLLLFEDLPFHLCAMGLVQQTLHFLLLREFPIVRVTSLTFLLGVGSFRSLPRFEFSRTFTSNCKDVLLDPDFKLLAASSSKR